MVPRAPATPLLATGSFASAFAIDVADVLFAWAALIGAELLLVSSVHADLLAGHWEVVHARNLVAPVALAMLAPVAAVAVLVGRLVASALRDANARRMTATVAAGCLGWLGYGVSFGRHVHSLAIRAPFIAGLMLAGAAMGYFAPRVVAKLSPRLLALLGAVVASLSWIGDVHVLPRLYPAFHTALFGLVLAGVATIPLALRAETVSRGHRTASWVALTALFACVVWTPTAARRLALADNLRLVLMERAPVLGRAVRFATLLASPPPLGNVPVGGMPPIPSEIPRALDWSGRDVLLVSVDALRADHVSAYGYARLTTPHIDALAREGALFEHAYCPTPHTSYSVTSMMTGKAMRPLMALGLGAGSETWAAQLRRYGFKTAAFYPPAVFYIDPERFGAFEASALDFEYAKVQFSSAEERVDEVAHYLDGIGSSPLFLWVHLFEPHEPYVMHASHPFGEDAPKPVDAYDSEIAYADDAVGRLVALVRDRRPGISIVVTADHGEEFGEHGGRYHGTSCYEEQVRVPLIVVGPGISPRRVKTPAQTIDLLPTVLSALGIPRPARVRGRDLGQLLAKNGAQDDPGLAYAETDEYSLVARGGDRLVCARRIGACALYDLAMDPGEHVDRTSARPEVARELRGLLSGIERDQGRYEGGAAPWPDPIRRGLMRELDASEDAAALLDDASAPIRRKAAEVMFLLHAPAAALQTRRALSRDEDPEVQKWCALALVRMGEAPSPLAETLARDSDVEWRRRAALSFASQGDARGGGELVAEWRAEAPPRSGLDLEESKERLAAMANIRWADAVPALLDSFSFVPLRPFLADALGAIGEAKARAPLLEQFGRERYETARSHEAKALLALGARSALRGPLAHFAGLPDPMLDAVEIAREAKLLVPSSGGVSLESAVPDLVAFVRVSSGPVRLLVLAAKEGGELSGSLGEQLLPAENDSGASAAVHVRDFDVAASGSLEMRLHEPQGILAAWVVPRANSPGPFDLHAPDK